MQRRGVVGRRVEHAFVVDGGLVEAADLVELDRVGELGRALGRRHGSSVARTQAVRLRGFPCPDCLGFPCRRCLARVPAGGAC